MQHHPYYGCCELHLPGWLPDSEVHSPSKMPSQCTDFFFPASIQKLHFLILQFPKVSKNITWYRKSPAGILPDPMTTGIRQIFLSVTCCYFSFFTHHHIKASEPSGPSQPYLSRNPYCISEYNGMRHLRLNDFFPSEASLHWKYNSVLSRNAAFGFFFSFFQPPLDLGQASYLPYLPDRSTFIGISTRKNGCRRLTDHSSQMPASSISKYHGIYSRRSTVIHIREAGNRKSEHRPVQLTHCWQGHLKQLNIPQLQKNRAGSILVRIFFASSIFGNAITMLLFIPCYSLSS